MTAKVHIPVHCHATRILVNGWETPSMSPQLRPILAKLPPPDNIRILRNTAKVTLRAFWKVLATAGEDNRLIR
jgi:hypothetical protein